MVHAVSSAISALQALGKKFSVTANNIANVTTNGFKKSRASSVDAVYGKAGGGVVLGEISESFIQGGLLTTESSTDLAISGEGYFAVRAQNGQTYYTRDGQFDFDNQGRLVDSSGNILQGWELDPESGELSGSIGDITIDSFSAPPQTTSIISATVNLDSGSTNHSAGANALSTIWDGDNADAESIAPESYAYRTTATAFDARGDRHDITVYFDRSESANEWEYIVTTNPAEDYRLGASGDSRGLLARGTLSFDGTGTLTDMSMAVNNGAGAWTDLDPDTDLRDGFFAFQADFIGDTAGTTEMDIKLDFGARYNGGFWTVGAGSSIQYAADSSTVQIRSDGAEPGNFLSVSVGRDGVITGTYSNGASVDLFQIAIARFTDPGGLNKVGNNLYSSTEASGSALTGVPGSNGLGRIVSQALEESNVDLAEEMTQMMLFQRSYQANIKVIETENEMKGDVLDIIS